MNLFDQISEDIKKAMLAKDKVALDALRGIKSFLRQKLPKVVMANCTTIVLCRSFKRW